MAAKVIPDLNKQILSLAAAFLAFAALGCSAPPANSPSPKAPVQTATPAAQSPASSPTSQASTATPATVSLAPNSEFDKAKAQTGYEEVKKIGKSPLADKADAAGKGQALFLANCALCHGETGIGNGPGGEAFDPKPRNLTDIKEYRYGNGELGIFRTAKFGIEGTGMIGWGDARLTDEEIWQTTAYVRAQQKP